MVVSPMAAGTRVQRENSGAGGSPAVQSPISKKVKGQELLDAGTPTESAGISTPSEAPTSKNTNKGHKSIFDRAAEGSGNGKAATAASPAPKASGGGKAAATTNPAKPAAATNKTTAAMADLKKEV